MAPSLYRAALEHLEEVESNNGLAFGLTRSKRMPEGGGGPKRELFVSILLLLLLLLLSLWVLMFE